MEYSKIDITSNINMDDSIYRYISLAQFLSLVENEELCFKKVTLWDDPWEGLDRQIPVIRENGNLELPNMTLADTTVGQCWTYEKDSDAMWRIYSQDKQGIMIETKVRNLNFIRNLKHALLAKVKYFNKETFQDKIQEIETDSSYRFAGTMALKRDAFRHENEVRLLICLQSYSGIGVNPLNTDYYRFNVNPIDFIESITFDPRAEEWFIETMKKYCASKGFICSISKSELYSNNFFKNIKIAKKYVVVNSENEED